MRGLADIHRGQLAESIQAIDQPRVEVCQLLRQLFGVDFKPRHQRDLSAGLLAVEGEGLVLVVRGGCD